MSQWFLSYRVLLFLFHFCVFLLQLSELVWKLAEGISLQSASKRLPSFGPSSNGNKSNAINTRICPNWNLTGTIYHWSVILRSFSVVSNSAKRDANGFFKLLLLSSHLLISGHPVRKSKFGACAVTGYCSFNSCHQCVKHCYHHGRIKGWAQGVDPRPPFCPVIFFFSWNVCRMVLWDLLLKIYFL